MSARMLTLKKNNHTFVLNTLKKSFNYSFIFLCTKYENKKIGEVAIYAPHPHPPRV